MSKIRIGLVGIGYLGSIHLELLLKNDAFELVGVYEHNQDRIKELRMKYPKLELFASFEALLSCVEAVGISATTSAHFELLRAAMDVNCAVFVEKPLCQEIEQAKELENLHAEKETFLQVGHVERFNPAFTALKNETLNPLFIEVHRLAQFNPRGTEVSVILDLMIHDIDIILSIVKSDVKNISASGVAVLTDTPDIANVRIEFNNGCVANLTSSRISMKKMRKIRLFQKDAYIGIDFLEKNTEIIRLKLPEEADAFSFDIETHQGTKTITISNPVIGEGNAILSELSSFVQAIENDTPTVVNEIDGYLAMEVAHQILDKISKSASVVNQSAE